MNMTLLGASRNPISSKFYLLSRRQKKIIRLVVFIIIALVVLYIILSLVAQRNAANTTGASQTAAQSQDALTKPIATYPINKTFTFDVKDKSGNVITSYQYKIDNAELRNEVVINGQKYQPVPGKTFLILSLEITNNYTQDIQIQPRNYIRVMMNNSTEKLAPDLYNQTVDVQPIATKPTSVGLAIDTSAKNIKLQVGEITGKKTTIPLKLQYK